MGDFVPSDIGDEYEPARRKYRYPHEPTEAESFGGISAGTGAVLAIGTVLSLLAVYAYFAKKQGDEYVLRQMYGK